MVLLAVAARPVLAAVFDPGREWQTVITPHFFIHHAKEHEAIARKVGGYAEAALARLTEKLDNRPWGKIHLILVDQNETANGFATVLPYNVVVLRLVSPDPDSSLAHYDNWLQTLVTHELTHIVHLTTYGYPAQALQFLFGKLIAPNGLEPGWITEGLATFEETVETTAGRGRSSMTEMLLRTDILNGRFLPIDKAAGSYPSWPGWRAQYLYGVEFMKFLAARYGEESLTRFSHSYGSSLWFYSLNHHAKKVFGKSFKVLWLEWEEELRQKYGAVQKTVAGQGLVEPRSLVVSEDVLMAPTPPADGSGLIYSRETIDGPAEIRLKNLQDGTDRRLLKGYNPQQFAVDGSGEQIVFSATRSYRRYYQFSDLFRYRLKERTLHRLTAGARAFDPAISPDGQFIAHVQTENGTTNLMVRTINGQEPRALTAHRNFEVVSHPRWSPDGRQIAAAVWRAGEGRDLYLFDPQGIRPARRLTRDRCELMHPWWSKDGRFIYASSDRTGIFNIWRIEVATGAWRQVTNVLSGVFQPSLSPDNTTLYVQYYNGRGYEIRAMDVGERLTHHVSAGGHSTLWQRGARGSSENPPSSPPSASSGQAFFKGGDPVGTLRPYRPGSTLLPRFIMPMAYYYNNALLLSATVGSQDPLVRHGWNLNGNYQTDSQYIGGGFGYAYTRFVPTLFTGASRYAVNFGQRFILGENYFEERHRGYAGVSMPNRLFTVSTSYFMEDRNVLSGVLASQRGTAAGPPEGRYAGLTVALSRDKRRSYAASISPEAGYSAAVNAELTDSRLGGTEKLEQQIFWTDLRNFVSLPAAHHVMAFRLAGGAAFGDRLLQGNFGLGGSLGEGLLAGIPGRIFPMRGLPFASFSRDRAFLLSTEYRLPLFRADRGISTWPVFMNDGHMALFVDVGNAWSYYPRFTEIVEKTLVSVGTELRGDFTISYSVTINGRIGYGIVIAARDRITTLSDELTGADAKYGTVVLQLGTSF